MAPTVRELLARLERERLAAEERVQRERRRRKAAEERAEQATRKNEALEQARAPSGFLDYVRWTESLSFCTFRIAPALTTIKTHSTTRVTGKFYPERLRPWDFATAHADLFQTLTAAFGDDLLFPPLNDVLAYSRDMSPGPADEQDLRPFIRSAIEKPASRIVTQYLRYLEKQQQPRRFSSIGFQNNAYGLELTSAPEEEEDTDCDRDSDKPPPTKRPRSPVKTIRIPDRWCVGVVNDTGDDRNVTHILVGQYKAAHKLPADKLRAVLARPPGEDFFVRAAAQFKSASKAATPAAPAAGEDEGQPPLDTDDVFIAQVLCQAYHYMVASGLAYGYVASGDGLILLHIREDDPRTLYYFWSVFPVPSQAPDTASSPREPEQTALAYLTSLCLLAIRAPVLPMSWVSACSVELARWPHPYHEPAEPLSTRVVLPPPNDAHDEDPDDNIDGGGGSGRRDDDDRYNGRHAGGGGGGGNSSSSGGGGGSGSGEARSTSTKRPRSSTTTVSRFAQPFVVEPPLLPYCTQACLRGLCEGTELDERCPNVAVHREAGSPPSQKCHPLTTAEVCERIVAQLATNMDKDCACLEKYGYFGRCGVLFKLSVTGYGYTFAAKGVQAVHRGELVTEQAVYTALRAVQGRLIPVCLGLVDLEQPLPLPSLARIPHLLLLSYAGPRAAAAGPDWEQRAARTTEELRALGLRNGDTHPCNMAWNAETGLVLQLDFDRAYVVPPRPPARSPLVAKRDLNAHVNEGNDGNDDDDDDGRPAAKRVRGVGEEPSAVQDATRADVLSPQRRTGGAEGGESDAGGVRV